MNPRTKTKAETKLVIDASVALKWQLDDEEYVHQAVALRDDSLRGSVKIYAPTLLLYEAINGLVAASRRRKLPAPEVALAINYLLAIGISIKTPNLQRATALALAHNVAVYDGVYLALAEQEDCEFWTGNYALYRAVNRKLRWVRWIGDYPLPKRLRHLHCFAYPSL